MEIGLGPRSPDLTICDFFLLGHLKHAIWNVPVNQQPQTINALKAAIVRACNNLNQQIIRNAFDGIASRARRCINSRGRTFPNE